MENQVQSLNKKGHGKSYSNVLLCNATPAQLKVVLGFFNLSIPERLGAKQMLEILNYCDTYNLNFANYGYDKVTAKFSQYGKKLYALKSDDGKSELSVKSDIDVPCVVCKLDVLNGNGPLGEGLICSKCVCYFHNKCTNKPLGKQLLKQLDNSPSYVRILCPSCMSSLNDNVNETVHCKDSFAKLENEVGNIKCDIQKLSDLYANISSGVSSGINTLTSNIEQVMSKVDKLDVTETNNQVSTVLDDLSDKFDGAMRTVDSSMSSIGQSVDCAMEKVGQLERIELDKLVSTVNKTTTNILCEPEARQLVDDLKSACENIKREQEKSDNSMKLNSDDFVKELQSLKSGIVEGIKEDLQHSSSSQMVDSENSSRIDELASKVASRLSNLMSEKNTSSCTDKPSLHDTSLYSDITATDIDVSNDTAMGSTNNSNISPWSRHPIQKYGQPSSLSPPSGAHSGGFDSSCTISIDNVSEYDFVKHTANVKKEFNKHFQLEPIVFSKPTQRGSILIQLESEAKAREVISNWKPHYFTKSTPEDIGKERRKGTSVILLEDKNAKGIVFNVDRDYNDEFMTSELQTKYPGCTAKRFVNREGQKLHTVIITFATKRDLDQAINNRIIMNYTPFDIRKFIPRPSVVQCYNCYKFNHISTICRTRSNGKQICPVCSQNHNRSNCLIFQHINEKAQFKCVNCNGQHKATDRNCPKYLEQVKAIEKQL